MTGTIAEQFKRVFESRGIDDLERPSETDVEELLDNDLDDDDADEDDNLFPDADDLD
jgi:hypothetical protein